MRDRKTNRSRRPAMAMAHRASANAARLIRAELAAPSGTGPRPRLHLAGGGTTASLAVAGQQPGHDAAAEAAIGADRRAAIRYG